MQAAFKTIFVTGGAGFIGSAVIRALHGQTDAGIVNVDKLSYAGDLARLEDIARSPRYAFEQVDICDANALTDLFRRYRPDAVMHLAAESHVDRSIDGPADFINTNIHGTYTLLEAARQYLAELPLSQSEAFRVLHVSTDEVYGSLGAEGVFTEDSPYRPNSPYSASKAASDHLVRAWMRTYDLPVLIVNCSNNYGPYQFPEKLIPLMIAQAISDGPLPVYGAGLNIRDWLYVDDHASALITVLKSGRPGETYAVGGGQEISNIALVEKLCDLIDERAPSQSGSRRRLIRFVTDRPGHDLRYAIDHSKITAELGWRPRVLLEQGLAQTVDWYLANRAWIERIHSKSYDGRRLGFATALRK